MTLNILDIFIIIPLLIFAWNGYKKGLIVELTTLVALVIGLYVAFFFSDVAITILNDNFKINQEYIAIIAFFVTFGVVLFLVLAAGKIVEKFIDVLMLGFINKIAGAAFGVLKGALLLSIFIWVLNYFNFSGYMFTEESRSKSMFYEPVESIAPTLYSWLDSKNFTFDIPGKEEVIDKVI